MGLYSYLGLDVLFVVFVSWAFGNVGMKYDHAGTPAKYRVNARVNIVLLVGSRSCFMMAHACRDRRLVNR